MDHLILLEKKVGETPLACLDRFRKNHPYYADKKMTYAGRLDPIASGLLLILADDKVHEKENYLGLEKTYECTMLIGVATDTYDILGIPVQGNNDDQDKNFESIAKHHLMSFLGTSLQEYPPFSSKTINGISMHTHARAGTLIDKNIPKHIVTVFTIDNISILERKSSDLHAEILEIISSVSGDFRQDSIKDAWRKFFMVSAPLSMKTVSFTIRVSGGTYIRGIVNEIGKKIGTGACVIKLHRTSIGNFVIPAQL